MASYNHAIYGKIMKSRNKVAKAQGKALKYQARGQAVSSVIGALSAKWDEYQKQKQAEALGQAIGLPGGTAKYLDINTLAAYALRQQQQKRQSSAVQAIVAAGGDLSKLDPSALSGSGIDAGDMLRYIGDQDLKKAQAEHQRADAAKADREYRAGNDEKVAQVNALTTLGVPLDQAVNYAKGGMAKGMLSKIAVGGGKMPSDPAELDAAYADIMERLGQNPIKNAHAVSSQERTAFINQLALGTRSEDTIASRQDLATKGNENKLAIEGLRNDRAEMNRASTEQNTFTSAAGRLIGTMLGNNDILKYKDQWGNPDTKRMTGDASGILGRVVDYLRTNQPAPKVKMPDGKIVTTTVDPNAPQKTTGVPTASMTAPNPSPTIVQPKSISRSAAAAGRLADPNGKDYTDDEYIQHLQNNGYTVTDG